MGSNFEFIDIRKDLIFGLCNGLEAGKGFHLEINGEECFVKGVFEVSEGSELLVVDDI